MRRAWIRLLLLLATLTGAMPYARAADTLLVLSDGAPAYEQTARRIKDRLAESRPSVSVESVPIAQITSALLARATLVVTIGTRAAEVVVGRHQPDRLICALLTHQTYTRLPRVRSGAQRSAVYIDQPASRQLALIRAALPGTERIAMVFSAASRTYVDDMQTVANDAGITLRSALIDEDTPLYNALRDVLDPDGVLVAVPDTSVYNNFTIQNILLTAYRERTPVIGFSPAYVRAGAILAVYSTPEQVGDQVARVVDSALSGNPLPAPAYPVRFSVSTNPHVARSLSLELPTPGALEASIRRTEGDQP
ncbi:hypothetical protein G3580_16535 [Nitrogeniibacter mangrovi]|uniref:ABC transporter substrate-binding protein n=1 Tax=Nitrogeniibacter mangrovi TaxID=2016596 RepID=A0A6C1B9Q1_9RHOO|nr:ABC transporter substrate binding protein [Nitrogeniibacter mangrovi]QID19080.1 hypothetical protein G3580_16535 [Nitrogeniibacter mangrovi]